MTKSPGGKLCSSADYTFKYILIGDSGVGKSSVLLQYTDKKFNITYDVTIGVDYGTKDMIVDKQRVKILVWDTAGQETFRAVTRSYYRETCCVVLMYDIVNRASFDSINRWLIDVQKLSNNPILILVGNKSDLNQKRCITYEEGEQFAKQHKMFFLETSAKTGENIDNIFLMTANIIMGKITEGTINPHDVAYGIKIMSKNTPPTIEQTDTEFFSCC